MTELTVNSQFARFGKYCQILAIFMILAIIPYIGYFAVIAQIAMVIRIYFKGRTATRIVSLIESYCEKRNKKFSYVKE